MLTRMKFTNWRSLRDVEIKDLTPLTVFIGANSSGKSNILEALHFVRYAENAGGTEAVFQWRVKEKIRTIGAKIGSPVELELDYTFIDQPQPSRIPTKILTKYTVAFDVAGNTSYESPMKEFLGPLMLPWGEKEWVAQFLEFITLRWQLLREGFLPLTTLSTEANTSPDGLYIIDLFARNVPTMLNFMQQTKPEVYQNLEADLQRLLGYVSQLGTFRDDKETRYFLEENWSLGHEAPTTSLGTARIIAMLTAYYALDMRSPELPGLVVIEEPDTAIHPLLLGKLVDLLRSYTERDEPRQFILTTHNPQFLNYFEPKEVQVVERDEETGETLVKQVPDYLKETWLTEHQLGDAWTSRIIGGIPEE